MLEIINCYLSKFYAKSYLASNEADNNDISAGVGSSGPPSLSPPELRLSWLSDLLIISGSRGLKLSAILRSDMANSI